MEECTSCGVELTNENTSAMHPELCKDCDTGMDDAVGDGTEDGNDE